MFDGGSFKSDFLQKKKEDKKKTKDQELNKFKVINIQSKIRSYLSRQILLFKARKESNVKLGLIMRDSLEWYEKESVFAFVEYLKDKCIFKDKEIQLYANLMIVSGLSHEMYYQKCIQLYEKLIAVELQQTILLRKDFQNLLKTLLQQNKGFRLLKLSLNAMDQIQKLNIIPSNVLLNQLLRQFSDDYIEIQSSYEGILNFDQINCIVTHLSSENYRSSKEQLNITKIFNLILYFLNSFQKGKQKFVNQSNLSYLLRIFLQACLNQHQNILDLLLAQNLYLLNLVSDDEELRYFEIKLRQSHELQMFSNIFLTKMEAVLTHPSMLRIFQENLNEKLNQTVYEIVEELFKLFDDRKILFIKDLISKDSMIRSMLQYKPKLFYNALKIKIMSMDDDQFKHSQLFDKKEWNQLIEGSILRVFELIKSIVVKSNDNGVLKKFVPFQPRNQNQKMLESIVEAINHLNKKNLRVNKISPKIFVNENLTKMLENFSFGMGAQALEIMLKRMPFVFSFQARIGKFKQFIKNDKKNYNRTLFLQEEVDEDLIIFVRRGHEFLDAFQSCMTRDLRKKYKIVFFNEQGLEEEGIDGGGIIKEFINRVLKSSFSSSYNLFYENSLHEMLPNPYSPLSHEYEFIGKIIGKSVYEGITIDQKFSEPFLNLLIGRTNTFEDMAHVDPVIYKNLLEIKKMKNNFEDLELTFTILDQLPNGENRYIDLLYPTKVPPLNNLKVNKQNKLTFVGNYSNFKCNTQIQEKTKLFRKGFLNVLKPEWLSMFSNQELNQIISGGTPDFSVPELKYHTNYTNYNEKDETIVYFWQVLSEFTAEEKSLFLLFVTSCSRPPTLGFAAMKPKLCICKDADADRLPSANTCMNIMRLPDYKNKQLLKSKLVYAINAKAGFEFA